MTIPTPPKDEATQSGNNHHTHDDRNEISMIQTGHLKALCLCQGLFVTFSWGNCVQDVFYARHGRSSVKNILQGQSFMSGNLHEKSVDAISNTFTANLKHSQD